MKAVFMLEHGNVDVLQYGNVPEPEIDEDEIKIRVKACGINRLDIFTRAGKRGVKVNFDGPHILGGDVAGDVVEIGKSVENFKIGQRVVVNPRLVCSKCKDCLTGNDESCMRYRMLGTSINGGYAEYTKTHKNNVFEIPDSLSYEGAAALPTVYVPCWNMFKRRAQLKSSETVLIASASSGVGSAAIQFAKFAVGATVIATTSNEFKAQRAKDVGADFVINYNEETIANKVMEVTEGRGADVIFDHVGTDFWNQAIPVLAPRGRYGICGVTSGYKADLQMGTLFMRNQSIFGIHMGKRNDLSEIIRLVGDGVIKPVIHNTFDLESVQLAHDEMDKNEFFGKLIINVP
ncbi:MAG: zinc-binding dehydrogenase [SAR202 cluster bacterium]|nr:zinc-binding dehydrogenase [SAR202 cluster bacterium]